MKRTVRISKETVNAALPPIPADFERDMREMILAMPAEHAEVKTMRKSRLSAGLVLAVVLSFIVFSALAAAILGGKDFVDQIMAPRAAESQSEKYTREEVQEILRIAKENNLSLSDQDIARLNRTEDGYWKEELMRLFVKTEYGFYPGAWPIEVQHWYEEMLEACGQGDGFISAVVPQGDEITEEAMLAIVADYIHQRFDPDVDLTDTALYRRITTYHDIFENPYRRYRQWYVWYEALDVYGTDYELYLDTQGNITKAYAVAGVLGRTNEMRGYSILDRFERVYGDQYGQVAWTTEMLLDMQKALQHLVDTEGYTSFWPMEEHIYAQRYVLPDDSLISREEAVAKAKEACGSLSYDTVYEASQVALCMQDENGNPLWKVTLRLSAGGYVYAQIDARSGEALYTDTAADTTDYRAWRPLVTEEYWRENGPKAASASVPGPREIPAAPSVWYASSAPKWYWDRLDAVGCSADTAAELLSQWQSTYGQDTHFWPLEAQAVYYIWQEMDDDADDISWLPGLPGEGDLSQEEALRIAKQAFKDEYANELPGMNVSVMKGAFSFWFNRGFPGHNTWQVYLYGEDGILAGSVWMESKTGEVYEMEAAALPGMRTRAVSFAQPIATPAPGAEGKPWMWGRDFAPQEHWDKLKKAMEAWGVTFDNLEQKEQEWMNQYGEDPIFWPMECQIISDMLASYKTDDWQAEKPTYLTFPKEGKLGREQAEQIALKALHEVGDEEVGAAWIDDLKCNALLMVNAWVDAQYQVEDPMWVVFYFSWDARVGYWSQQASVYLTEDGEVIFAALDLYSNG